MTCLQMSFVQLLYPSDSKHHGRAASHCVGMSQWHVHWLIPVSLELPMRQGLQHSSLLLTSWRSMQTLPGISLNPLQLKRTWQGSSRVPMVNQKVQWRAVRTSVWQTDVILNSCKLCSVLTLGHADRPDSWAQERAFPLKQTLFRAREHWRANLPGPKESLF